MHLIGISDLLTSNPQLSSTTLVVVGFLCLVAAVIGGGLKAAGVEIRVLKSVKRQWMLGLLGVVLITLGLYSSAAVGKIQNQATLASDQQRDVPKQTGQTGEAKLPKQTHSKPADAGAVNAPVASIPGNPTNPTMVPAEEAQLAIIEALDSNDIQAGMNLLFTLNQGAVKAEECDHVYDYALKNTQLTEAKSIVDWCWEGASKAQRVEEINHEYQKQR